MGSGRGTRLLLVSARPTMWHTKLNVLHQPTNQPANQPQAPYAVFLNPSPSAPLPLLLPPWPSKAPADLADEKQNERQNKSGFGRDGWRVLLCISNTRGMLGQGEGYRGRRGEEERKSDCIEWDVRVDVFRWGPNSIWQTPSNPRARERNIYEIGRRGGW